MKKKNVRDQKVWKGGDEKYLRTTWSENDMMNNLWY